MSDALAYLVKARPEAMGHYFAFLKDAGRHLDPKTRNLISVITKVHEQTERGLKQYLKRALNEGATPAEVLDALLMAFPALGLAKIVWAVDVILAMELPGFAPEAMQAQMNAAAAPPSWHDLAATSEFARGEVRRLDCDGRSLFVLHAEEGVGDDAWRVYDSRCPHQSTDIPHLALEGRRLTCPKHEWAFDIESGRCVAKGDTPLKRWPARVANGRLLAQW
jgi:nitrite reductase/ring-hydroxylating ferredoxin subunit/alkylhydroperoxidase/carboxymuconolactone decarboxylase family protein YurZ